MAMGSIDHLLDHEKDKNYLGSLTSRRDLYLCFYFDQYGSADYSLPTPELVFNAKCFYFLHHSVIRGLWS